MPLDPVRGEAADLPSHEPAARHLPPLLGPATHASLRAELQTHEPSGGCPSGPLGN